MSFAIYGRPIPFGLDVAERPLRGFPEGKAELQLAEQAFALVLVTAEDGSVRRFHPIERDGFWEPLEQLPVPLVEGGEA